MTDDELDRALFALPLEEPPADLHRNVLAATVYRTAPAFQPWELWLLAAAIALVAGLTAWIFTSQANSGVHLSAAIMTVVRSLGLFSRSTYVWLAVGISSIWWISSLPFMAAQRPTVYNR